MTSVDDADRYGLASGVTSVDDRLAADLLTPGGVAQAFRVYPAWWTKAGRISCVRDRLGEPDTDVEGLRAELTRLRRAVRTVLDGADPDLDRHILDVLATAAAGVDPDSDGEIEKSDGDTVEAPADWDVYPRVRLTVEGVAVPGRHDGSQAYIPATADSAHVWLAEPAVRNLQVVADGRAGVRS